MYFRFLLFIYLTALGILALAEKKGYDEFVTLVEKAGLKKELATAENLTVFVPSNEAIQVQRTLKKRRLHVPDILFFVFQFVRLDYRIGI